jgi:dTDP-glucose 4,6-dehydratase
MNIKSGSTVIITGCAGFIGSHVTEHLLACGYKVVGIDKMTYAGKLSNMKDFILNDDFSFYMKDINIFNEIEKVINEYDVSAIINCAAETHVDNSIIDCTNFLQTNIMGVKNLLEICKIKNIPLLHFSTDEVYGDAICTSFIEESPLKPKNPYSASKAAADHLIASYNNTYKIKYLIVRPSNNFGPRQHKEKFIPTILRKLKANEKIPIYGNGKQKREWTYVKDTAKAIELLLNKGVVNEIYNISSNHEEVNINVVSLICKKLNIDFNSAVQYVPDRLGHDFRYSVNCDKIKSLGFSPDNSFEQNLDVTII